MNVIIDSESAEKSGRRIWWARRTATVMVRGLRKGGLKKSHQRWSVMFSAFALAAGIATVIPVGPAAAANISTKPTPPQQPCPTSLTIEAGGPGAGVSGVGLQLEMLNTDTFATTPISGGSSQYDAASGTYVTDSSGNVTINTTATAPLCSSVPDGDRALEWKVVTLPAGMVAPYTTGVIAPAFGGWFPQPIAVYSASASPVPSSYSDVSTQLTAMTEPGNVPVAGVPVSLAYRSSLTVQPVPISGGSPQYDPATGKYVTDSNGQITIDTLTASPKFFAAAGGGQLIEWTVDPSSGYAVATDSMPGIAPGSGVWTPGGGTLTLTKLATVPATPAAATFTDQCGTAHDTYTVPATTGVEYLVGGNVVPAGSHPATGTVTVTVTAKALSGYALKAGTTSTWTHAFTTASCASLTGAPTPTPMATIPPAPHAAAAAGPSVNTGGTVAVAADTHPVSAPWLFGVAAGLSAAAGGLFAYRRRTRG